MTFTLQSTDPESLSIKNGCNGDAWSFLRRGNRIDFVSGVKAGGDGNRRGQTG